MRVSLYCQCNLRSKATVTHCKCNLRSEDIANRRQCFLRTDDMPYFRLETNIACGRIPANYHQATTQLIAKLLGKPEQRCCVSVIPEIHMTRGGTSDPCAFGTFTSIGKQGALENRKHAAALFEHVEKHLGIPKDRLVIQFVDEKPYNLSLEGTTMEELMESQKH